MTGAQSLLARDLIRPLAGSPVYQVESGLAALLHWLCDSERVITIHRIQRESKTPGLAVCLAEGMALLVEIEPTNYTLTLFQNSEMLLPTLMELLSLPADITPTSELLAGKQPFPEPEYLIPLAWRNPVAARAFLERLKLPTEQIAQYLNWATGLSQLLWISENDETDFYLASTQQTIWLARPGNSPETPIIFSGINQNLFSQLLDELFSVRISKERERT